jgi:enoyl-CoA hydratase/carnithine racemase
MTTGERHPGPAAAGAHLEAASQPPLHVRRRGPAVWLTLSRPEAANALSRGLVEALGRAVDEVHADPSVRVVVVTGEGRTFCAGADLKERRAMSLDETRSFLDLLNHALTCLAGLPCAVIAAINGGAFGGGLELALACDLRIASDVATLGLVETRLGIIPGAGGTQRLARVVGVSRAKELILTGRRIDAPTALAMGLVSAVVPLESLDGVVSSWVDEIAAGGPLAITQAKTAIDEGSWGTLDEGLRFERRCYEVVLTSADRDEGLAAFAEKRPPRFQGK